MNYIDDVLYKCRFLFAIIGIVLLYGVVGYMDYHDARVGECSRYNKEYNEEKDICK